MRIPQFVGRNAFALVMGPVLLLAFAADGQLFSWRAAILVGVLSLFVAFNEFTHRRELRYERDNPIKSPDELRRIAVQNGGEVLLDRRTGELKTYAEEGNALFIGPNADTMVVFGPDMKPVVTSF